MALAGSWPNKVHCDIPLDGGAGGLFRRLLSGGDSLLSRRGAPISLATLLRQGLGWGLGASLSLCLGLPAQAVGGEPPPVLGPDQVMLPFGLKAWPIGQFSKCQVFSGDVAQEGDELLIGCWTPISDGTRKLWYSLNSLQEVTAPARPVRILGEGSSEVVLGDIKVSAPIEWCYAHLAAFIIWRHVDRFREAQLPYFYFVEQLTNTRKLAQPYSCLWRTMTPDDAVELNFSAIQFGLYKADERRVLAVEIDGGLAVLLDAATPGPRNRQLSPTVRLITGREWDDAWHAYEADPQDESEQWRAPLQELNHQLAKYFKTPRD